NDVYAPFLGFHTFLFSCGILHLALVHINQVQSFLGLSVRGFSAIASCKNFQHLDISFKNIDDANLVVIPNSAFFLHHLSLVKCESVRDMQVLLNFKALEYLNLDQCLFVNDEGLDFLVVSCSRLSDLSL
ncbi:hypothetical protein KI387_032401, partial [Taxus chinensis]